MTDQEQGKWLKQIDLTHDLAKHMATIAAVLVAFAAAYLKPGNGPISVLMFSILAGMLVGGQIILNIRRKSLNSVIDYVAIALLSTQFFLFWLGLFVVILRGAK